MYFPLLRGRQSELMALREVASGMGASRSVFPVIEPVHLNSTTSISLARLSAQHVPFGIIYNPRVGKMRNDHSQVALLAAALAGHNEFYPAYYVNQGTTPAQVTQFLQRADGKSPIFVFEGETNPAVSDRIRAANSYRLIFRHDRTSQVFRDAFDINLFVPLDDPFARRARNADYPPQEYFSDRSCTHQDHSDYSIVGDDFSERGGAAHAVTLHHVYFSAGRGSALHVRHFVSDRTRTAADPAGKFLEALTKLVVALPGLGADNETATCDEYRQLLQDRHYPNLSYAKRLAVRHHLQLFL